LVVGSACVVGLGGEVIVKDRTFAEFFRDAREERSLVRPDSVDERTGSLEDGIEQ